MQQRQDIAAKLTKVLLLVLATNCFAPACGESLLGPSPPTSGPQCSSVIRGGTFSAVIDGEVWNTTSPQGGFDCGFTNALTIVLTAPPTPNLRLTVSVAVTRNLELRTYPVANGVPYGRGVVERTDGKSWLSGGPASSGSVTVTSVSAQGAAGSFSFVLAPSSAATQPEDMRPMIITNGTFDVRF